MRAQIPSKLKIQRLINRYSTDHIKGFHRDKVYYICNCIYLQMQKLDKETSRYNSQYKEYYVPLWSVLLKKMLGDSYVQILEWMKKAEIIVSDDQFIRGEKCRYFRLKQTYLQCRSRWVTIQCKSLYKKNRKQIGNYIYYYRNTVKKLKALLQDGKLTVDYKAAIETINQLVVERHGENWQKSSSKLDGNIKARLLSIQLRLPIEMIHNRQPRVIQDDKGFRLHTTITALKRELRPFVKYDKKELAEIDIKNSQFFFLIYLLNSDNWKYINGNHEHNNRKRIIFNKIEKQINNYKYTNNNIITLLNKLEKQYGKGLQQHPFLQHVYDGDLYERIIEQLDDDKYDFKANGLSLKRAIVKKNLISLLFADPIKDVHYYIHSKEGMIWRAFTKLYPEIVAVINEIKKINYKLLSWLLQRVESYCVFSRICYSLLKYHPEIPLFTLHDSIITTTDKVMLAMQYMQNEIEQVIGRKPGLKLSKWCLKETFMDSIEKAA